MACPSAMFDTCMLGLVVNSMFPTVENRGFCSAGQLLIMIGKYMCLERLERRISDGDLLTLHWFVGVEQSQPETMVVVIMFTDSHGKIGR